MRTLIAVLLLVFAALVLRLNLLAFALLLVGGVLFLTRAITARWTAAPSATRELSETTAQIGDSIDVAIAVLNSGRLPIVWMLVEDLLPNAAITGGNPMLTVEGERICVTRLNPGGARELRYRLQCNRRGYFQIGPLVMETGDMFGLNRRFRVLTEPDFLLVLPRVVPLIGYDVQSRRPIGEVIMAHRLFEDPTRISGVRQYQRGDPLSRVHWRATARTGTLQSKVFEPSSLAGASIVIDFHQDAFARGDEPVRSDLAITAAASIGNLLFEMNQQFGLLSNGRDAIDRIREEGWQGDSRTRTDTLARVEMKTESDRRRPVLLRTGKSPHRMHDLLRTLARLEKSDGLTFIDLIFRYSADLPRDATVIAIISRVNLEVAAALAGLRHQGYSVTAVINCYDDEQFAVSSGRLLTHGIQTRHLKDDRAIQSICMQQALVFCSR